MATPGIHCVWMAVGMSSPLRSAGHRAMGVAKQAGVGRGLVREADLHRIDELMVAEVEQAGGHIAAVYYCPHDWEAGCRCRKPKPGVLFRAKRELGLDLSRTVFV